MRLLSNLKNLLILFCILPGPLALADNPEDFRLFCEKKIREEGGAGLTLRILGERVATKPDCNGLREYLTLTKLDLSRAGIKDIEPLKFFLGLKELSLRGNAIENLRALKNLAALQNLDVTDNQVRDLSPLRHLANLKVLKAQRNKFFDTSVLDSLRIDAAYFSDDQICEQERLWVFQQGWLTEDALFAQRKSNFGPVYNVPGERSSGLARFLFCGAAASAF